VYFHYKGWPDTTALYIQVALKNIEFDDIIKQAHETMKRLTYMKNDDDIGLSYISYFDKDIMSGKTIYNFWYQLSMEDRKIFN
jgi:hypothetical protein